MFLGFLGQFRQMASPDEEAKTKEKPPEQQKSPTSESFLSTPEAKTFIKEWAAKKRDDGKPLYTRRGLTDLLSELHNNPGLSTDKKVLNTADRVLKKLGGMDKLTAFLAGWKAKSEGIIKGALGKIFGK